jgi:hypothetical protein
MKFVSTDTVSGVFHVSLSEMIAEYGIKKPNRNHHDYLCFMVNYMATREFNTAKIEIPGLCSPEYMYHDLIESQMYRQWGDKVFGSHEKLVWGDRMEEWNKGSEYSKQVMMENPKFSGRGSFNITRREYREWMMNKVLADKGDLQFEFRVEVMSQLRSFFGWW